MTLLSSNAAILSLVKSAGQTGNITEPVNGDFFWPMDDVAAPITELITGDTSLELTGNGGDTYQEPSLRLDNVGKAARVATFDSTARNFIFKTESAFSPPYSGGLTIEFLVKPQVVSDSGFPNRSASGHFSAFGNAIRWTFQWDNLEDVNVFDLYPVFAIAKANNYYTQESQIPAGLDVYIRGTELLELGKIYHVLFTFRPSDNTIELWINGVSIGTDDMSAWINSNILDGTSPTYFRIGSPFLVSSNTNQACDNTYDNLKVHLLEADQAFVDQQIAGAIDLNPAPASAIVFDASSATTAAEISGDGTKSVSNTGAVVNTVKGDRGVTGKIYIELLIAGGVRDANVGLVTFDTDLVANPSIHNSNPNRSAVIYPFTSPDRFLNGSIFDNAANADSTLDTDIFMIALDTVTGNVWSGLNGAWFDGNDPALGATPTFVLDAGEVWTIAARIGVTSGAPTCTVRTEASDMDYTIPAGFVAISEGT